MLPTESLNPVYSDLDLYPTDRLVTTFVDDQFAAIEAVRAATGSMTVVVEAAAARIAAGGRLIYVGAGTSGRLGLLDCTELGPTFAWPKDRGVCVLAGGEHALFDAVEGAEDDSGKGAEEMVRLAVAPQDVVLLIAASGSTPFVLGALREARSRGALTVGLVNNPGASIAVAAELAIVLDTGPEVIAGSTRLKAGTAQKVALNTLSSCIMVRLNKVFGNLMVDMRPTNDKLNRRAVRMIMLSTGSGEDVAREALTASERNVKVAVVSLKAGVDMETARRRLEALGGSVRRAIGP